METKPSFDNDYGRIVLYPGLEYKMPWKTRLLAIAVGVGAGIAIVGGMMAAIVAWV